MISFDEFIKQDDEEKDNNKKCDMFQIQALEDELKNRDIYISKLEEAYSKELERLKNIINKTIESLQEHYDNSYSTDDVNDIGSGTYDDLMEILKGANKE